MHETQGARLGDARDTTVGTVEWEQVLRSLASNPERIARWGLPTIRTRRVLWLEFTATMVFAFPALYAAWWSGMWDDWMWFWLAVLLAAVLGFGMLRPSAWHRTAQKLEEAATLREAIVAGDDTLAPPAIPQPARVYDDGLANGSVSLRPLYRPEALDLANQGFSAGLGLFIGLEQFTFYFFPSSPAGHTWQSAVAGSVLIVQGLVHGVRVMRSRCPFTVISDEHGLTWRQWGKRHTIDWQEVRALSLIEIPSSAARWVVPHPPPRHVYWLAGAHDNLVWMPSRQGRHQLRAGVGTSPNTDDPAWLLCRTVVTRTARPLRDLTQAAMRLTNSWARSRSRRARRGPLAPETAQTVTERERVAQSGLPTISYWATVLLVIAVVVAGIGVLVYQPGAYADRLAYAQTDTPLLADSMTKPTGLWPVGTTPGGVYVFSNDGYTLTQGSECCAVYAWAPPLFRDATVEVTVHQVSEFNLSEAGLVLHANDVAHTMLVFTVTPGGEWHLKRFQLGANNVGTTDEQTLVYEGVLRAVGAIHQGPNATNRLAVIMRGNSSAFFINGQFVGAYHDDGLAIGHVGVYTDGLSQSATFTNFAVYPAPPPSPLSPV